MLRCLLLIGLRLIFFIKTRLSRCSQTSQKYLTDHLLGMKVMAHFCASFRLHVAQGLVRSAVKVGPTQVLNSGETDADLDTDL